MGILNLVAVIGALGMFALAPSSATAVPATNSGEDTQTTQGGGVTVAVTRQEADYGLTFKVVMDTHSVNLDTYDLLQLAVLRTDQGLEVHPIAWDAPPGGHHREGLLTFPATLEDGNPVIGSQTADFELVIRDIAGVPERTARWAL